MNTKVKKAPAVFLRLIRCSLPFEEREYLLGDMDEMYRRKYARLGPVKTVLWLISQIVRSVPVFLMNLLYWSIAMVQNYIKIMLRNMFKHKLHSLINIAGLAIGMACCIMILLWVKDELSYDRFHTNADAIFRVVQNVEHAGGKADVARTPAPLMQPLKDEIPEISKAARIWMTGFTFLSDMKRISCSAVFADPDILEMFTFPLLKGSAESALAEPTSIVLTKSGAEKLFGSIDPIGKSLTTTRNRTFTVTGIIDNIPHNSHLQFEAIVPMQYLYSIGYRGEDFGNANNPLFTYVMTAPNTDITALNEKIGGFISKKDPRVKAVVSLQPLRRIHLHSHYAGDIGGHGDILYVYIFSAVAALVLLIACINFMNLSTARSGSRAKEVGMRKVVGAYRTNLMRLVFRRIAVDGVSCPDYRHRHSPAVPA